MACQKCFELDKISMMFLIKIFNLINRYDFFMEFNAECKIVDLPNFLSSFGVILALAEFEILTELAGRVSQSCLTD